MDVNEFMAIKHRLTPNYTAAATNVYGGFIVTGTVTYIDREAGSAAVAQEQQQAVAATAEGASSLVTNWLISGRFDFPYATPTYPDDDDIIGFAGAAVSAQYNGEDLPDAIPDHEQEYYRQQQTVAVPAEQPPVLPDEQPTVMDTIDPRIAEAD